MIHYHGTPLTPRDMLHRMAGRHFCVSFARPDDLGICLAIGQSVMLDNGAFSTFTRGEGFDHESYYRWCAPILRHPHWAVIPDVIGGDIWAQLQKVQEWPFGQALGVPVFHIGLDIRYLLDLLDKGWWRIALGSSASFWKVGSGAWSRRMDNIFNELAKMGARPWIHGLRMLGQLEGGWPLASADSTNVAQNWRRDTGCPNCKAESIDAQQGASTWTPRALQQGLL